MKRATRAWDSEIRHTKDPKYFSRLYGQSGFLKDLALDRLVGLSPGSIAPAGKLHP